MMNRSFYSIILTIACVSLFWTLKAEGGQQAKKAQGRSLASISPVTAGMGQGEQMLYEKSKPWAVRPRQDSKLPVKIEGVCRDSYGYVYNTTNKGYANCVDTMSRTNVDTAAYNYFGPAQRQAGAAVGVQLGK